jgi:hypothetical protein
VLAQIILRRDRGAVRSWQGGRTCNGRDAHELTMLDPAAAKDVFAKFGIGGPLAGVQHRGRLARQGETVLRAGN